MKSIFERVRELDLPLGEYVVVGGAMEAHGIRPEHDIDIIVNPALFKKIIAERKGVVCECDACKADGKQMFKAEGVDYISHYVHRDAYRANTDELIQTADIIEGLPFVALTELMKWKEASARPKDIEDIARMKAYLGSK